MNSDLISIHGGHSGEFCLHAHDNLEEIVQRYIKLGFCWVGITEHMPPLNDDFLYKDELQAGLNAECIQLQFANYMRTARRLQKKYKDEISLKIGFETECYNKVIPFIHDLIKQYSPDYIVASVHHVNDINFDYSEELYKEAVDKAGSIEKLYLDYFDHQLSLIEELHPAVVGHFDLIRIYDKEYENRLRSSQIWASIERNLLMIKKVGAVLDFNGRALKKGAKEPYPTRDIILRALELKIPILTGDDSHGVADCGSNVKNMLGILKDYNSISDISSLRIKCKV